MQKEKYGVRDLCYSAWHRVASIRRYVGWERAQSLSMCDADCVLFLEYEGSTKEPLALIETAQDVGQSDKPATAITRLAQRAKIPAYLILYSPSDGGNPADRRWRDVRAFRVRRLWPRPESGWRPLTPKQWADGLLRIRAWAAARLDHPAANDPIYDAEPQQGRLFR
jgi:hypothetical protein